MAQKKNPDAFDAVPFVFGAFIAIFFLVYYLTPNSSFDAKIKYTVVTFVGLMLAALGGLLAWSKYFPKQKQDRPATAAPPPIPPAYQGTAISAKVRFQRRPFLSPAEFQFFEQLQAAVPAEYQVHCKVGLWGLVENLNREDWPKIAQKQLDFVLFHPGKNFVALVIELDDSSHCSLDAQKRDAEKNAILAEAGIPILRIRAAGRYDVSALWINIKAALIKK